MTMQKLAVSANGRFLQLENGKPFFWLGDTGWLLFSRLNKEEAEYYLEVRRRQGYNVIQVMGIHHLSTKNVYGNGPLIDHDLAQPLLLNDPAHEGYWEHADDLITMAERKGLYLAVVPVWGAAVKAGRVSVAQAEAYGRWLGKRYAGRPNIIML